MGLRNATLVVLLLASICLSGCNTITLHLIQKRDIQSMLKDVAYTPEVDGWFVSDYYMEKVMGAKVGDIQE